MFSFDPQQYGPRCAELIAAAPPCPLGPGTSNADARRTLESLDDATLFPNLSVRDPQMADCCRSGLWLLHNFLDASHRISQDIPTAAGSYWHGIMHRREPDYSNAKYWFGRVGGFPTFEPLADAAEAVAREHSSPEAVEPCLRSAAEGASSWDAAGFVDLCRQAAQDERLAPLAREIAHREWQLLFDYCYREAVSE